MPNRSVRQKRARLLNWTLWSPRFAAKTFARRRASSARFVTPQGRDQFVSPRAKKKFTPRRSSDTATSRFTPEQLAVARRSELGFGTLGRDRPAASRKGRVTKIRPCSTQRDFLAWILKPSGLGPKRAARVDNSKRSGPPGLCKFTVTQWALAPRTGEVRLPKRVGGPITLG